VHTADRCFEEETIQWERSACGKMSLLVQAFAPISVMPLAELAETSITHTPISKMG